MVEFRVCRRGKGWGVQQRAKFGRWFNRWKWHGPFGDTSFVFATSFEALKFGNLCEQVVAREEQKRGKT